MDRSLVPTCSTTKRRITPTTFTVFAGERLVKDPYGSPGILAAKSSDDKQLCNELSFPMCLVLGRGFVYILVSFSIIFDFLTKVIMSTLLLPRTSILGF